MNRIDKAASWLGAPRAEKNAGKQSMSITTGTATSDSENGFVSVIVGDTTITENNDGQSVEIPTSVKVLEGDTVIITRNGNDVLKTPMVSDVIGGGDRAYVDMSSIAEAAAEQAAAQVEQIANEAKEAAEAIDQHFYSDDNGVHVVTKSEAVGPNILVNSNGVLLRDGYNVLSSQTRSGFSVYEYGNSDPSATFGTTTVIGKANQGQQLIIDNDSIDLLIGGNLSMHIGQAEAENGTIVSSTSFNGDATSSGSFADSGGASSGGYSHADSGGTAGGNYSHADSRGNTTNYNSHADSGGNADGQTSHADSSGTATGMRSHAQCLGNAKGMNSFASGEGTITTAANGTALGSFNKTQDALFVIGDGDARGVSDALVLRTGGDLEVGYVTADKFGAIDCAKNIHAAWDITSDGMILDTPINHLAAREVGISEGTCRYVKSGHVVQLYIWCKLKNALATYSTLNLAFTGLPPSVVAGEIGPIKIDNSTGSCFVNVDTSGNLKIISRETAIAANGVITGSCTYISSE